MAQYTLPASNFARRRPAQPQAQAPRPLDVASAVALATAERNYKHKHVGVVSGGLNMLFLLPIVIAVFVVGFFFWPLWILIPLIFGGFAKGRRESKDAKYILRAARKAATAQ